jgi:hypothetical protein
MRKPYTFAHVIFWVNTHGKTPRENQYLVDFITIKSGLSSWDSGPPEE